MAIRSSTFNTLLLLSFILLVIIIISTNAINQNFLVTINNSDDDDERNNTNSGIINNNNNQQLQNLSSEDMQNMNFTIANNTAGKLLVNHMVEMLCGFKISPMLYIYFQNNLQTSIAEHIIRMLHFCLTPLEIVRYDSLDETIPEIDDDYVKTFSLNIVQTLNDINLFYVKKNSADKYNSHFIILIEKPIISNTNTNQWLKSIFNQFWQYHIFNALIIYRSSSNHDNAIPITMVTYSPFINNFLIFLSPNNLEYKNLFWDKAINLNQHPLRVSLFPERTRAVFHSNNQLTGTDGYLTKVIIDKMNATLQLLPPDDGFDIGEFLKNGTVIGSLAQIVYQTVDVSFNTRFLRLAQFQGKVQITITNGRDDICILVAKAGYATNFNNIFRAFSLIVWLLTLTSLISVTCFYTIISYIENDMSSSCWQLPWILFNFYSWNLAQPIVKLPKWWSTKILIGFWIIYGLLITSSYQGNLTSNLISRPTLSEINTIRQLEQSAYEILTFGRYVDLLQNFLNQTGTYNRLKKRIRGIRQSEMFALIKDNNINYAYANKFHINQYQSNLKTHIIGGRPVYYNMKECPVPYLVAYGIVYGSPYLHRINTIIRRLQESGLVLYWDTKSAGDMSKSGTKSTDGQPVSLTVDHVQSAFYILFMGLILALIIFCVELIRYKIKNNLLYKLEIK